MTTLPTSTTLPATVQEHVDLPTSPQPGEGRAGPLTAGDVFAMLRRRMVLLIALCFLFCGLSVAGFWAWWTYFPGYRSECLIECVSNIPDAEPTTDQERIRRDEHEAFVLSQALLLKSPAILTEALKLNAVRETQWHASVKEGKHLLKLMGKLTAAPVRGTNFLRVAMACRNTTDARVIVAAVVAQWYDIVRRRSAEEFATAPLDTAREEKRTLERAIRDNRDRLGRIADRLAPGVRMDPQRNASQARVLQGTETVGRLRLELAQLKEYQAIYSDPQGAVVTAEDRALVEQDPQVAQATQTVFQLEQQRAAALSKLGERHPAVKQIDAVIEAAEETRAARSEERLREIRAEKLELTDTAVQATKQALFSAQESLALAEASLKDQDKSLLAYTTLEAVVKHDEERLLALENDIQNLSRVLRRQSAVTVNIAQPATEPLERSSPNLILLPVSLVLAISLAVGIALGIELLDESVRTSRDIARHLQIAMLGAVPSTDDEEVRIDRVETAVRDAPRSMIAEAFRRIRTNLQFSAPVERQRTLLITSPRPDDGKTTVACNLGMAVAQGGRRVLLVDANFRRPALTDVFGKAAGPGLSNLLVGDGKLASYVVKTDLPNLDLLGSGPVPPNPADLLGSAHCHAFLQEAISRYDQVILDTAPVLLASDTLGLSSIVDGVVVVVRANRNSRGVARRACSLLAGVNAHVFGAVLNAAQVTRGGYYREQLRAHYDYQTEAEPSGVSGPLMPPLPKEGAPTDRAT